MNRCYIALGGNQGDVRASLLQAVQAMGCLGELAAQSRLIETQPWGVQGTQNPYINGVVELHTRLSPEELLAALFQIEADLGRNTSEKGMLLPRPVDLDLIDYQGRIIREQGLVVPHPRMHQRLFVLEPLAEIAPNWTHPELGQSVQALIETAKAQAL